MLFQIHVPVTGTWIRFKILYLYLYDSINIYCSRSFEIYKNTKFITRLSLKLWIMLFFQNITYKLMCSTQKILEKHFPMSIWLTKTGAYMFQKFKKENNSQTNDFDWKTSLSPKPTFKNALQKYFMENSIL